jgi:DNA-binding CsgD family transcriptional regulator/predicted negative regulator of RcsB-dependent stress response
VSAETTAQLDAGARALEAGDWAAARVAFEAVLAQDDDSATAHLGLGDVLAWQGDVDGAVRAWQHAYGAFRRGPEADPVQAAVAAIDLSITYSTSLGNDAAARGWLDRLARLVDDFGLEPLRGWVLVIRAALDPHAPAAAEEWAREALELARRFDDRDLELCALCEVGVALTGMGRVEDGLALLGEAMAGSLGGEAERLDTVIYCCCRTIVTCSLASQTDRGAKWIRAAEGFTRRYGGLHLQVLCRVHYGGLLFASGRWEEAEVELLEAVRMSRGAERVLHGEALARLAELRIAQGRVDEAARLVAGFDDQPVTAAPRASLHLARSEPEAAAAVAGRRVRELAREPLAAAPCVELLTLAELALGAVAPALARASELAETGARLGCEPVLARGERAAGRCLMATGDPDGAVESFERALEIFARRELPFEAARARLLLAEALAFVRPQAAVAEARSAQDAFERLGAVRDADAAAALLRSLGVKAARSGPKGAGVLTKRETEVLELLAEGLSNKAIAARLFLAPKTVEHHVHSVLRKLDLGGRAEAAAYMARTRSVI